jgi:hypothetical protein
MLALNGNQLKTLGPLRILGSTLNPNPTVHVARCAVVDDFGPEDLRHYEIIQKMMTPSDAVAG